MNLAIEVSGLQKSFGEIEAVRGVSFEVARGEVFGFLGPNGAGKTTTINMLCTLARPTGGSALVAGHDVVRERDDVRRNIGLVFQDPTLDGYLTAEAEPAAARRALRRPVAADRAAHAAGARDGRPVGPPRRRGRRRSRAACGGGWRSRAGSCTPRACCSSTSRRSASTRRRAARSGATSASCRRREEITIFMTTHYMDEAEFCDRIAIMDRGEIVVLDTPEALKASVGADRVRIQTDDDEAAIAALARALRRRGDGLRGRGHVLRPGGRGVRPAAVRRARACRSARSASRGRRSTTSS